MSKHQEIELKLCFERQSNMNIAVQSFSHVWLFATLWTAARQASLSITISQSLLHLMSTESMMPSNHLILCGPLLPLPFSESGYFSVSWLFISGGQSIGASASASVLPLNIQGWSPLGWIGLISLQTLKSLLQHHSSKAQFFGAQPFLWSKSQIHTWILEKP